MQCHKMIFQAAQTSFSVEGSRWSSMLGKLTLLLACNLTTSPRDQAAAEETVFVEKSAVGINADLQYRTRYLLLDSRIVDSVSNARLMVGTVSKHPHNPLFAEDKPWEKRFDNLYGNVLYDQEESIYKCWYSPFIVDNSAKGMSLEERKNRYRPPRGREMGICYATSKDGIRWEKPCLGEVEYDGGKENNIVWRGPHGAGIFKDAHADDPLQRYKMIFQGMHAGFSADGIRWQRPHKLKGIGVAGDTHNNALWAPTLGKYVGFTRTWGPTGREVMRIESDDFVTWKQDKVVMRAADKAKQPYAMPVFYHGGVYLGLVAVHHQPPVDRVWTELAWSPDTVTWYRINEGTPLVPNSDETLDCDYGCVYACASPVFLEGEIRLYYGGSDYTHYGWRVGSLCLATLRPDGFAGYHADKPDTPATIVTHEIAYEGETIAVTADVEKGGHVRVSVVDENGRVLDTAKDVLLSVTDHDLQFERPIKRGTIHLRFEFSAATLYSFKIN